MIDRDVNVKKRFIEEEELLEEGFRLAVKIFDSGFRPDFIVGIWRGGAPVGIAVQEILAYAGIQTDNIAIRFCAVKVPPCVIIDASSINEPRLPGRQVHLMPK